ncbi:pyridoxamine 5'-phosphate oxidase family protein [Parvibaculum sp.]|uniref:pyridoxamine 5'-phosphate oxidase family protein n=1 Tax=Parvibaculum sp. TaxID=2024848 RepID=UPI001DF4B2AA|nr:pyridoxamine 5'-phosphate oxidase family protein [Parvibaculum sp.]MBX3489757.1 pyridoxamine 5'-phosphate oxidase family protein [Parvibaculum sp.]MCW5726285.1 pyridoxamine 5'-phosphate oxidase family protein [Parvibaculum sp.]
MAGPLKTEEALRTVYPEPSGGALGKQLDFIDPHSRRFIELSPFLCIGSSRPDGLADVSPRGGEPGFVHVLDERRLAMPDRPGNNRLDTLTNIAHAPAVGLLFFLPGFEEMLRINGLATTSVEPDLMARLTVDGKPPRSVLVVEVKEVYLHCTKALKRSGLWNQENHVPRTALPSFGEMLRDQMKLDVAPALIDTALEDDAKKNLY